MRKNIWKWGLFILLLAPVMTACKDDDEDEYNFRNKCFPMKAWDICVPLV